ncbi:MAG: hypothetical protein ACFFG0_37880 [Candidatus Thorarchaeota archaeon]
MVKFLRISNNLLESIPSSIGNVSSVKKLNISENSVKKLPKSINRPKNLKSLILKGINQDFSNLRNDIRLKNLVILK